MAPVRSGGLVAAGADGGAVVPVAVLDVEVRVVDGVVVGVVDGSVEGEDDDDDDEAELDSELDSELDCLLVTVPSVVAWLKVLAAAVRAILLVCRSKAPVIPLALANTVVPRSLAVPHPNCENPPSN